MRGLDIGAIKGDWGNYLSLVVVGAHLGNRGPYSETPSTLGHELHQRTLNECLGRLGLLYLPVEALRQLLNSNELFCVVRAVGRYVLQPMQSSAKADHLVPGGRAKVFSSLRLVSCPCCDLFPS